MLDTLMTVKKFNRLYNWGTVLASGYYEFSDQNFDYGPIFSTFGYNDVEGLRLRAGGRTYFGPHDLWRLQGFWLMVLVINVLSTAYLVSG